MYDFQIGRIAINRAKLLAIRPHCAAIFDSLFLEEELQNASPAFVPTHGKLRRLPANMDQANRTANLLASDTVSDAAIQMVAEISKKNATEVNRKKQNWKNAGAPKTIPSELTAPGRIQAIDYFWSITKYYTTLFALNELKAHQAVHSPTKTDLAVAGEMKTKIAGNNREVANYLDLFLLQQIKNAHPETRTILPSARAALAINHLTSATADPEYLNQLVLFDLETQRKNVQALNPINPHFQKVLDRLEVVRQAAQSLGLEK